MPGFSAAAAIPAVRGCDSFNRTQGNPMTRTTPITLAASIALAIGAAQASDRVFDTSELDTGISACQDLNAFVNAKWIAANPIPADRTRWGSFDALREQSLTAQHAIAEKAAANADRAKPGSIEQKIGWLYRSGMDEAAIEKAGFDPIKPDLAAIAKLQDTADVVKWLQQAYARGEGQGFGFGSGADYQDASKQVAYAMQGGLGLPTPDYYTKDEHAEIRKAYVAHLAKLFELTGVPAQDAAAKAEGVLAFETRLAKASLSRVEMRYPKNRYHWMSIAEANKVTPHFDWNAFFAALDVRPGDGFSLSHPKFFAEFDAMLAGVPVAQWRDYLAAHTISDAAPYLSKAFQDEDFAFSGKTLNGQPEQLVRWKRVLDGINGSMGEARGQL